LAKRTLADQAAGAVFAPEPPALGPQKSLHQRNDSTLAQETPVSTMVTTKATSGLTRPPKVTNGSTSLRLLQLPGLIIPMWDDFCPAQKT